MQSALDAIQIHGANGYSNEFPVERYLRNSKAAVIYEGTSELHTLIQADYALGYREDRPLRCEPWPAQGFERQAPEPRKRQAGKIATSPVMRRAVRDDPQQVGQQDHASASAGRTIDKRIEVVASSTWSRPGVGMNVRGPRLPADEREFAEDDPIR